MTKDRPVPCRTASFVGTGKILMAELIVQRPENLEKNIKEWQRVSPADSEKKNDERLAVFPYLRRRCAEMEYPVRLVEREQPDFVLKEGGAVTGLEVTKLTTRPFEQGNRLSEKQSAGAADVTELLVSTGMDKGEVCESMWCVEAIPKFKTQDEFDAVWRDQLMGSLVNKTAKAPKYEYQRLHLIVNDRLSMSDAETVRRICRFRNVINNALRRSKFEAVFIVGLPGAGMLVERR